MPVESWRNSYAVLMASNAASALVMLRSNDGIDLLFTDLEMPGSMASNWRAGPVKKFPARKCCSPQVIRQIGP